jgi:uncharacterized protein YggT (Ycf19 family)
MIEDQKLAIDETNRTAQHEAIKGEVRQELQDAISRRAARDADQNIEEAAGIRQRLKDKAIKEVTTTEAEIERARVAARISQTVDYVFFIIYGLIGLEVLLELIGARENNVFKELVDAITAPLLVPFRNLVPDVASGRFQLKISYVVAFIVYILLHLAINGLLRMMGSRKTVI